VSVFKAIAYPLYNSFQRITNLRSQKIRNDFLKEKYKWWAAEHLEANRHPDLQGLLSQLMV
jgi:hypothetical protein